MAECQASDSTEKLVDTEGEVTREVASEVDDEEEIIESSGASSKHKPLR